MQRVIVHEGRASSFIVTHKEQLGELSRAWSSNLFARICMSPFSHLHNAYACIQHSVLHEQTRCLLQLNSFGQWWFSMAERLVNHSQIVRLKLYSIYVLYYKTRAVSKRVWGGSLKLLPFLPTEDFIHHVNDEQTPSNSPWLRPWFYLTYLPPFKLFLSDWSNDPFCQNL